MKTCELLGIEGGKQVVVGRVSLNGSEVTTEFEPGNEGLADILESPIYVDGGRNTVTAESDPEVWFEALPLNYSGTNLRARMVTGAEDRETRRPIRLHKALDQVLDWEESEHPRKAGRFSAKGPSITMPKFNPKEPPPRKVTLRRIPRPEALGPERHNQGRMQWNHEQLLKRLEAYSEGKLGAVVEHGGKIAREAAQGILRGRKA